MFLVCVEDCCSWYGLYYLAKDRSVNLHLSDSLCRKNSRNIFLSDLDWISMRFRACRLWTIACPKWTARLANSLLSGLTCSLRQWIFPFSSSPTHLGWLNSESIVHTSKNVYRGLWIWSAGSREKLNMRPKRTWAKKCIDFLGRTQQGLSDSDLTFPGWSWSFRSPRFSRRWWWKSKLSNLCLTASSSSIPQWAWAGKLKMKYQIDVRLTVLLKAECVMQIRLEIERREQGGSQGSWWWEAGKGELSNERECQARTTHFIISANALCPEGALPTGCLRLAEAQV